MIFALSLGACSPPAEAEATDSSALATAAPSTFEQACVVTELLDDAIFAGALSLESPDVIVARTSESTSVTIGEAKFEAGQDGAEIALTRSGASTVAVIDHAKGRSVVAVSGASGELRHGDATIARLACQPAGVALAASSPNRPQRGGIPPHVPGTICATDDHWCWNKGGRLGSHCTCLTATGRITGTRL